MVAGGQAEGAGPFEVTDRLIFSIAVPMTLAFLTTPLLGLVDTAVVGRLGSAELIAGLASGRCFRSPLFHLQLPARLHDRPCRPGARRR